MIKKKGEVRVSQRAILFTPDGSFLVVRRTATAPVRALEWELPGGVLEYGEDTKEGIMREIQEETGLVVGNLTLVDAISLMTDWGEFWVTLCYAGTPTTTEVTLSYEHDDFRWVTPEEFQTLKASPQHKALSQWLTVLDAEIQKKLQ